MFVKITDNVLEKSMIDDLSSLMINTDLMPWYYRSQSAYNDGARQTDIKYEGSFVHSFIVDGNDNSQFAPFIRDCITKACQTANMPLSYIHRAKAGLFVINPKETIHPPHVDFTLAPKYTGLIYVNDSDGDTIIYNEDYDISSDMHPYEYYTKVYEGRLTVNKTVKPTSNRLLCFNTNQYHSASSPTYHANRIAINFNFD